MPRGGGGADGDGEGGFAVALVLEFSVSFAVSMPNNEAFHDGATGPLVGLLTSFQAVLGSFHMSDYDTNAETQTFFVIFLFSMVIVMLNLLIAIMTDTFERVKETEELQSRRLKAETIITETMQMTEDGKRNKDYFPSYLQVLQPVEEREDEWSGLGGSESHCQQRFVTVTLASHTNRCCQQRSRARSTAWMLGGRRTWRPSSSRWTRSRRRRRARPRRLRS